MVVRILFILTITLLLFQNCTNKDLESIPYVEQIHYKNIRIKLCLNDSYANYTLENFIPVSLGFKNEKFDIVPDSDFDGLSDQEEENYGFDKLNPRSTGGILDSVCFRYTNTNDCSNLNLKCHQRSIGFGLNDCETELSGIDLAGNHPANGLDTDKDGIMDIIEIIRGTDPLVADALADVDNDQRTNLDELLTGGNLSYYDDQISDVHRMQFSSRKVDDPNCSGETWEIDVKHLPWIKSKIAIDDPTFSNLAGESLALLSFKIYSLDLSVKNMKVFTKVLTLKENQDTIDLTLPDFNYLGEVLK
jgi:hypothetical protein